MWQAIKHMQSMRLASGLQMWKRFAFDFAEEQRLSAALKYARAEQATRMVLGAIGRVQLREVARAWRQWEEHATAVREAGRRFQDFAVWLRRFVYRMQHVKMLRAWHSWRIVIHVNNTEKASEAALRASRRRGCYLVQAVVRRRIVHAVARRLNHWMSVVRQQQLWLDEAERAMRGLQRAISAWNHRKVSRGWRKWQIWLEMQRTRKRDADLLAARRRRVMVQYQNAVTRMWHRLLFIAWHTWRDCVERLQALETERKDATLLLSRHVSIMRNHRLFQGWIRWHFFTMKTRQAAMQVLSRDSNYKPTCMQSVNHLQSVHVRWMGSAPLFTVSSVSRGC